MTTIRILRDVVIPMRDGTVTAAEVWLPDDGVAHPALLSRTPYLKEFAGTNAVVDGRAATARGYVTVLQDVRGCGGSEGTFEPFVNEERDGVDTVAWVAEQPWCDGRVVMGGMSYIGATQWLAAAGGPPALAGIAPALTSDDYAEGWSYTDAVAEHGFLTTWSAASLAPVPDRMLDDSDRAWDDVPAVEKFAPWLRDWLESSPGSDFWRRRSVADRRSDVRVPVLITGGWYDIFLAGTLRSFARSRDPRDRLILGPWCHDDGLSHLVGTRNVGIAGGGIPAAFGWTLDFYDAVLAGREPDLPRVRAYVLGARRWLDLDAWPPPGTEPLAHALEPGEFAVDPAAPVPALGGRGLLVNTPGWGNGIADQRPLLGRDDVHLALRETLSADVLLAGPITAKLSTAASGDGDADADALWVATLCVQQPDGALDNLSEGVAVAPASADRVSIDLGHTCAWLPAGSTLVLLVAGSSFPRWPRPAARRTQRVLAGSELRLTTAPAAGVV